VPVKARVILGVVSGQSNYLPDSALPLIPPRLGAAIGCATSI